MALIAASGAASLLRALQEPSTGYQFALDGDSQVQAIPLHGDGPALHNVRAISTAAGRVAINASTLTETGGVLDRYEDQHRFYLEHRQIWQLMQSGVVRIEHAAGTSDVAVSPKRIEELGLRFWFPWFVGLLSLSVGLGVWLYSPTPAAARGYLLASAAYAFIMLMIAPSGSRLLTQNPVGWHGLQLAFHAAAYLQNSALALLLWGHPTRLGGRWFATALLLYAALWLGVDLLELVPTISIGFRAPIALFGLLFMLLFVLQWRVAAGDPVKRAQLKWLVLLFMAGLAVVFAGYVYGAGGGRSNTPQVYGLGWISLLYLGLVPLVTRVGLFQLEAWWVRAWLWFLGGLVVIALDLMLVSTLSMHVESALLLAMAIGGWVYFPLRQWVWRKLSNDKGTEASDLLPDIVALASTANADIARRHQDWLALLDRVFSPMTITERPWPVDAVAVAGQGRALHVPGGQGLPALELNLAQRGQRLFRADDVRRATEIVRLVQTGLTSHQSFEQGATAERQRIASDLHDDLGARLLSIAQSSTPGPAAEMARHAMEELRLSVRGLSGSASPLAEVMADWRSESVSRLTAASIEAEWSATEVPPDRLLSASLRAQVTRILREAVSNVIRHSAATLCHIEMQVQGGQLILQVQDNGSGLHPLKDGSSNGSGLANMERRASKLGGSYMRSVGQWGGVCIRVAVPLNPSATIDG